jgi:hypothetical protein
MCNFSVAKIFFIFFIGCEGFSGRAKDEKKLRVQKDEVKSIEPELILALGRSVSLRLRL